jgi:hypothetical protein
MIAVGALCETVLGFPGAGGRVLGVHGSDQRPNGLVVPISPSSAASRGRPGYVVDHIRPLACGGLDVPSNTLW